MDLNLLTTFLTVYKHASITIAAEELNITQPAVSAALKRLEKVVGKRLFVREGRGISPTGAAVALAHKIESPLSVLDSIEQQQEHLNMYCSESVMHMVGHLNDIYFSETPLDEDVIVDDLVTQKVDLVIDAMSSKRHSLIVEEFHQERAVCLTRLAHPRIQTQMTIEQFYAEEHIALKVRRNNLNTLGNLAREQVFNRTIKIETGSVASMLALCAESDYIAAATTSIAEKLAPKLGLRIHNFPIDLAPVKYFMLYHRRYLHDPSHKEKRELLKSTIAGVKHK
ncbi:LysR family transcriptional regulator [Shewanella maritima]|uniref:LysR family transcriptional regulator n=1 Tax=Shewanella maritima TaxID=2520507 RepID=UPI0037351B98